MAGAPMEQVFTMPDPKKPNNLKTGLLIGALALFFFVAFFAKQIWLR